MLKPKKGNPNSRLREARLRQHWSQQEVADKIGTTPNNVSRWELGLTTPGRYFRAKLNELFGKTAEDVSLFSQAPLETSETIKKAETAEWLDDPTLPLFQPLVGREALLDQLQLRLCNTPPMSLVSLVGLPGVGKTALATALAYDQRIREHFCGGILWVGLGPHPRVLAKLRRWGTLLQLPPHEMNTLTDTRTWAYALKAALGSRRMLLIIDDAWKLEDALAFRIGNTSCSYLLTSRFVDLAHQWAREDVYTLPELSETEALSLLSTLAPYAVETEPESTREIIRAVGGLPLAITLLGNYLQAQTHSQQIRRLQTTLDRLRDIEVRLRLAQSLAPLEQPPHLSAETPISLHATIEISDQFLDEQTREGFYALSVFPAKPTSFSEEAALAVACVDVEVLDRLNDIGLLESKGSSRYMLHQTIADYARIHLESSLPAERLIEYAVSFVEAHPSNNKLLTQESDTIFAALETAYTLNDHARLIRGVFALVPFLLAHGLYAVAETHIQRACTAATMSDNELAHARALLYLGQIMHKLAAYEQATTSIREGLTLARGLHDVELISNLLCTLAATLYQQGKFAEAEVYYQEGLTSARLAAHAALICRNLNGLGVIATQRGNYQQAEDYYTEGLALARQTGQDERICALLTNLGAISHEQGNLTRSEGYYQEGLALARQREDRERSARFLMNLGVLVHARGDNARAESYWREGLALVRQIGHRELQCGLLLNLGEVLADIEDEQQAEACYHEGLALARQIGNTGWASILLTNLGELATKQKHYALAETYLEQSLTLARQIGKLQFISMALAAWGELRLRQHHKEAALRFQEMLDVTSPGQRELQAQARYGLARVAVMQGNLEEAHSQAEASFHLYEAIGHRCASEVRSWMEQLPPRTVGIEKGAGRNSDQLR